MAKVDIPFTDESLSTSDPSGSAVNIILLAVGFAALGVAAMGGSFLRDRLMSLAGVDQNGQSGVSLQLGA